MSNSTRDLISMRDYMLGILGRQQDRRNEYAGNAWIDVEIDVMHHEVCIERSKAGLPDLDRAAILRVEAWACGHSDYSSKFALYCAELALGRQGVAP